MKAFKKLLFSAMCIMAIVTIASCDKDNSGTGGKGGGKTHAEYIDLGLRSGTLWKSVNEENEYDYYDFFTFDEAVGTFGDKLPTKEQFEELKAYCQWTWTDNGYKVVGPNGKSIFLPAAGYRTGNNNGNVSYVGSGGYYWSSTSGDSRVAWRLDFFSDYINVYFGAERSCAQSVRLVQN